MVLALKQRAEFSPRPVDVVELDVERFGATLGALHGLDAARAASERERFVRSAVDGIYLAVRDGDALIACGSAAVDGTLAGIFGMVTVPALRGRGLATALVGALLDRASARGATIAYLQVDATNAPARRAYERFGFADRYAYWYRTPSSGEDVRC
jgi:predicted GNAT family acetyltransferase